MMGRKNTENTCCACLTKGLNFNKLSKKDDNEVTLLTKLKTCIKEVKWTASFNICIECTNLLNTAYAFRETCINSEHIRKRGKGVARAGKNSFKEDSEEEILPEGDLDTKLKEDGYIDLMRDDLKDEDYEEELYSALKDIEGVNDSSNCSGSDEQNDNLQSDLDNEEYDKKQRRVRKRKENPKKRRKLKFECEKCNSNFQASTKLVEHCINEHEMKFKDVKPFVCDRCPQRFSTSSNLWQHIKYHDGIKSNMCSYCGKGFITKTDLGNHEKKHLNMREYKCEACGKSFNTHKDIRSHKLIVHTDSSKWKYICEICSKPFPIKSNYDSHMRRHTGDKKFACHLCEKKFTTKCDLQRHTRSHSHVREHKCQHCEKEYKDERVLKVHMAKIHGIGLGKVKIPVRERKYACHFCPKAYYAKNKLTRHIYTHSGEKPFNCPICQKKFNDKSYVKQHLRNTHNVEEHQDTLENELKISYMNSSGPAE